MSVITVTSTADQGNGTLRAAINAAQPGDTIEFTENLAGKTIRLTSGQLVIDKDLVIDGGNAPDLTISGNNRSRVFEIGKKKEVTLENLIIANGKTEGPGGGIRTRHESTLLLRNVEVNNNVAELGGGLRVGHLAKATIIDSSFDGNDGTLTDKHAGFSAGAIVHDESRGRLVIKGSSFTNNKGFNGGAIYGRATHTFVVEDSIFRDNISENGIGGGAIFTDGVSPRGDYSGPPSDETIVIRGSKFEGNQAESKGGALFLWGYDEDHVILEDTVFVNNTVTAGDKDKGKGGAIWAKIGLDMRNVTVADNTATQQGGGLWLESNLPANIVNSTFSGNEVLNDAGGAMFLNTYSTPVNITNSTIAYNEAGRANGALWFSKNHNITLKNSIVAFNEAGSDRKRDQVGFQAIDGGGNIEFSTSPNAIRVAEGSTITDPRITPLQDVEGTLVHPLSADSPAIDAGVSKGAPSTDQRGVMRDSQIDVGAFESQPISQPTSENIGEYGTLNLNHEWQTISLDEAYVDPVVIVSDPTLNGKDPAAIRLRNITDNTFQIRLQEANYKDGWHTNESVSYLVMEAGDWTLSDGTRISAGTYNSNRLTSQGFDSVNLKDFGKTPTVLSQVQTFNGSDWVTTRTKGQSSKGFQLAMQEEEALNAGSHVNETIGWLAVDQGESSDGDTLLQGGTTGQNYNQNHATVTFEQGFDSAPAVIAKLGSYQGGDTANVRLNDITSEGFGIGVHEEQSLDTELTHNKEAISFLALEGKSGVLTGFDV
ncbi:MAG: choice-of-anchor Q domain-containing protein [Cyanobacteria bacterium P01_F01_bin.86]